MSSLSDILETKMTTLLSLTTAQLRRAVAIKDQIEGLHVELAAITGDGAGNTVPSPVKGGMSAAGRARIAAAQRARWAKLKDTNGQPAKKGKRAMSAAWRAKIAAAARARWAKAKKAGRNSL